MSENIVAVRKALAGQARAHSTAKTRWKKIRACWTIMEYRDGWRLGFSTEEKTTYLPVWFDSWKDAEKALGCGIVFVHLAGEDAKPSYHSAKDRRKRAAPSSVECAQCTMGSPENLPCQWQEGKPCPHFEAPEPRP